MDYASFGYPVQFDAERPERFERVQVFLRILVGIGLGTLHQSFGTLFCTLYFYLPVVAAILITRAGGLAYLERDSGWLTALLGWVLALYAYLFFVTDRFPLDAASRTTRFAVQTQGAPSVGTALLRIVTSLPQALFAALLGIAAAVVGLVAGVSILIQQRYPASLHGFQRDFVAVYARLFAYHCSLVGTYPPFRLSRTPHDPRATRAGHANA